MSTASQNPLPRKKPAHPFRRAVLRGLGILMPPLLTIVLFVFAWGMIETHVLKPLETLAAWGFQSYDYDTLKTIPPNVDPQSVHRDGEQVLSFVYARRTYTWSKRTQQWVGYHDLAVVKQKYLQRRVVLPVFIPVFILILYLLGKFVAAGVGRYIVRIFEALILRIPLISNVYSASKQVSDFVFTETEIEFNRVVAIEYPRKGIWSIGFVTGESMLDVRAAANEPVLSVLMPTSPMPVTGFTITVRKSEALDLNLTVDQAIQFIVSCGVVVPPQQLPPADDSALNITGAMAPPGGNGQTGNGKSAEQRQDSLETPE